MNKLNSMTLYTLEDDVYCHRLRIVLAEKSMAANIIIVDADHKPDTFLEINPYGDLPTLVDRELVLNESKIIMEYLDERFPHPPLLPVYPVSRAKCRLMIHRIESDWYSIMHRYDQAKSSEHAAISKEMHDYIMSLLPIFKEKPYFLSDEFTLVDCCIAPLLWRLPKYKVTLDPKAAQPILDYCQRVFNRESFQAALTDAEHEIREDDEI